MILGSRRRYAWIAAIVLGTIVPSPAQATTPEELALAEELFHHGKQLMSEGNYADGCPKLAESHRLDPAGGTLLTLALCHEAQGRTASAWAEFSEAQTAAKRDRRADREAIAREHIDTLFPRLVRLRVHVARENARIPALVVRKDASELVPAAWDLAAPVDPGEHEVEASAPGYEPIRLHAETSIEGTTVDVTIPPLVPRPLVLAPTEAPAPTKRSLGDATTNTPTTSPLRIAGYATTITGAAAIAVGIAFAFRAAEFQSDANASCPRVTCSDRGGVDASHDAGTSADAATAFMLGGAIALVVGVGFFIASTPKSPPRAAFTF